MCCFFTTLLLFGPRLAAIVWWIINPVRWVGETNLSAFDSFIWPVLGIIFLPWTTLMYVIIFPGGIEGLDWLWMGVAVFFDVAWYAGGGFGNRDRIPGI